MFQDPYIPCSVIAITTFTDIQVDAKNCICFNRVVYIFLHICNCTKTQRFFNFRKKVSTQVYQYFSYYNWSIDFFLVASLNRQLGILAPPYILTPCTGSNQFTIHTSGSPNCEIRILISSFFLVLFFLYERTEHPI